MGKPNGHRQYLAPGEAYIERAGQNNNPAPVILAQHGGYGALCAGGIVLGPWAYYEHAEEEARKHGGRVVLFRKHSRTDET